MCLVTLQRYRSCVAATVLCQFHVLRHGDAEGLSFPAAAQRRAGAQVHCPHSGNSRSLNHRLVFSLHGTEFGDRQLAHLYQGASIHFQQRSVWLEMLLIMWHALSFSLKRAIACVPSRVVHDNTQRISASSCSFSECVATFGSTCVFFMQRRL